MLAAHLDVLPRKLQKENPTQKKEAKGEAFKLNHFVCGCVRAAACKFLSAVLLRVVVSIKVQIGGSSSISALMFTSKP